MTVGRERWIVRDSTNGCLMRWASGSITQTGVCSNILPITRRHSTTTGGSFLGILSAKFHVARRNCGVVHGLNGSGDRDWRASGGIVAQLTNITLSPAVGFAFVGEGAGVVIAGSNGLEADAGWHLDGDWDAGVGGGIVAQLTMLIQPPTVGLTSGGEGAGVEIVGSDGLKSFIAGCRQTHSNPERTANFW